MSSFPEVDEFLEHHAQDTIEEPVTFEDLLMHHAQDAIYSDMTVEEFFAHWGVKGMRWGVRKGESGGSGGSGGDGKGGGSSAHDDHVNVAALRKKKVHELSNAEMKAVTERMNLEKKYKEMNPSDHELLMRKLRKHTDTATKVVMWMATPTGKTLLKSMGLDPKSRKNDEKAKLAADLEKRKAKLQSKADKKAAKKAAAAAKPKGFKEMRGPDGGVVYNPEWRS